MFRYSALFMLILGIYLLFSPVIALFKFIPLIGWFLAHIVSFAATIFAVLVGSILHLLTLTAAWIFYRPLFGICLLFGVGLLIGILMMGEEPGVAPK